MRSSWLCRTSPHALAASLQLDACKEAVVSDDALLRLALVLVERNDDGEVEDEDEDEDEDEVGLSSIEWIEITSASESSTCSKLKHS